MIESAVDIRLPFSADLVRSRGINLTQQLEMLAPFAEALAERVGVVLSGLGGVPIKVTLVSAKAEKLKPHFQVEAGFYIVSDAATVSCWSQSDLEFDNLMCEVFFGGSGGAKSAEFADRPATVLDKKLRLWVSEVIARAAADALGEIGEHVGLTVRQRARVAARKAEAAMLCYSVRLLLNVFDDACEYEIFLSFDECMKLIGGDFGKPSVAPSSAGMLVEKASFLVEVFLKPDVVDVRQILNLVPGEVLKLNVAASSPVELRLNGKKLSLGNLSFDKTGGRIKLIDAAQVAAATETQEKLNSSAGQYGN